MGRLGPTELLIVLALIVLVFGARKLPDLARGSGQALRIFKAEVRAAEQSTPIVVNSTPEKRGKPA